MLMLVASLVFVIHFIINESLEVNQLIFSYSVNVIMAFSVVAILFLLHKKFKDQLGFVFMAASMFKFVVFFLFFYPNYKTQGDLKQVAFLSFFIPYVVCLVTESLILSRFLNGLDDSKEGK